MENIVTSICFTIIGVCVILMVKNSVTFSMHNKITDAIFRYKIWHIDHGDMEAHSLVDFWDVESYEATLFRIWDWGYKRILPPEKFELIKPFIK